MIFIQLHGNQKYKIKKKKQKKKKRSKAIITLATCGLNNSIELSRALYVLLLLPALIKASSTW